VSFNNEKNKYILYGKEEKEKLSLPSRVGFLNLSTIDILGWMILCCGKLSCAL